MSVHSRDELVEIGNLFARAASGSGRAVLVTGSVASGKTSLLHEFADQATDNGALLLNASCVESECALPLGVMSQLLLSAGLRGDLPAAARQRCDHAERVIDEHRRGEPARPAAWLAHDIGDVLLGLARDTPLVIAVDDVHHADAESWACLGYLTRRLRFTRVLLVLTCRGTTRLGQPPAHADVLTQPHFSRITLRPLGEREIVELTGGAPRDAAVQRFAAACLQITNGNPLLVNGLVADNRPVREPEPVFGAEFAQSVLACLHRCGPDAVGTAAALAVAGVADGTLLAYLVGGEPETVATLVEVLELAGLVCDGRFRHPAVRAIVLDQVPARLRAELHAKAARHHYDEGAPAASVARHLLAGPVDEPWAGRVLREAADRALADDDTGDALAFLSAAVQVRQPAEDHATVAIRLARLKCRTNPEHSVRHLAPLTESMRRGELPDRHTLSLIRYLLWLGHYDDAVLATQRLLGRFGELTESDRAEVVATARWMRTSYPPVHARLGLDGVQLDAPADIRALAVANLRVQAITALTTQTAEDLALGAEQVLQTLRLTDTTLAPLHDALLALIQADQLGKAIEWCDRLIAETVQRRAPGWEGVFCSVRAIICIRQGDLPEAERQARTSLAQLTARGWGVAIGIPLACLLFAVTAMGRYAEAETICAYPVPDAMYQSVYGLYYVQARGYFHLETDRLHAALADFTAVDELLRAWQVDGPNLVAEHTGIAEVYLRMGETDTARSLLERQLAKLGPARSRSRGVSLRLLAATVDLKQRLSLLTEAVEILETCDDQFELARALADLSRAHHGFGESNRARMLLRRASHLAGECQAAPLSRTLVPIMPASPPGDRPSDVLTSAEARVAVLAARGHTNRQIARKLYVTVSTVEQHLTRVYRKLGVDRRSQLPEEIMQAQSVHTA